jgi:NADH:ubiquinone oxidoreductase subunit 6 (subunit J)
MQLLIYVGGTLVLLIFGVMLTAQARFISMKTSGGEWLLAALAATCLLGMIVPAAFAVPSWNAPREDMDTISTFDVHTSTPIGLALTGVRVDQLDQSNEQLRRGMSGYLFPFVIVSMHLLVVLVGAAYMARTKRLSSRLLVEQPMPPAPRVRRPRSFAVIGGIVSGIVVNALLAALCFAYWLYPTAKLDEQSAMRGVFGHADVYLEPAADWLCPVLGTLFLASVLMLLVIDGWQRWGVVGLVLVTILQALAIGNSGLPPAVAWIFLVIALAPVALLIALLCSGPRPTVWEQMD